MDKLSVQSFLQRKKIAHAQAMCIRPLLLGRRGATLGFTSINQGYHTCCFCMVENQRKQNPASVDVSEEDMLYLALLQLLR